MVVIFRFFPFFIIAATLQPPNFILQCLQLADIKNSFISLIIANIYLNSKLCSATLLGILAYKAPLFFLTMDTGVLQNVCPGQVVNLTPDLQCLVPKQLGTNINDPERKAFSSTQSISGSIVWQWDTLLHRAAGITSCCWVSILYMT